MDAGCSTQDVGGGFWEPRPRGGPRGTAAVRRIWGSVAGEDGVEERRGEERERERGVVR
jgi:hypothetical protein